MPTEETQVEELTERDATGKTKQQEQKRLVHLRKLLRISSVVPTEDTQVEELTEQHSKRAKASEQPCSCSYKAKIESYDCEGTQIVTRISGIWR